jgi:DNA mismatch endonuclease (patch repair protein)
MAPENPRRRNMQANRRRDTKPEVAVRRLLHARGLRYRCDFPLVVEGSRVRPDIVFTRAHVAVFVDGCFWHACPDHGRQPRVNDGYWRPKLQRNKERDERNTSALRNAGWIVIRAWEHESAESIADRIEGAVRQV